MEERDREDAGIGDMIRYMNANRGTMLIIAIVLIPILIFSYHHHQGYKEEAWKHWADWDLGDIGGQLKHFSEWIADHNITHVYMGKPAWRTFHDLYLENWSVAPCEPTNGVYGMQGSHLTLYGERECYSWLKEYEPSHYIGSDFIVWIVEDV